MRFRFSLLLIASLAFTTAVSAQSVVITSNKVTYKRHKPMSDYKKTFTINYPKVRAATPALSRKIESAISYASVLKLDLKEELTGAQWLEEADYEVNYNKNGILSIALSMDGSAAYPDGSTKHVVVDIRTGKRQTPTDVFTNIPGLLKMVRSAKDKEVAQAIIDIKKDPENGEQDPEELFKDNEQYNPLTLKDFIVTEKGVTFYYDYGFPHVIQALQPAGEFFLTWKQLKPYIKPSGLLAHMAR